MTKVTDNIRVSIVGTLPTRPGPLNARFDATQDDISPELFRFRGAVEISSETVAPLGAEQSVRKRTHAQICWHIYSDVIERLHQIEVASRNMEDVSDEIHKLISELRGRVQHD